MVLGYGLLLISWKELTNGKSNFFFQIYVIDSADQKRFEETGLVCTIFIQACKRFQIAEASNV